jgi:hypothetical protein
MSEGVHRPKVREILVIVGLQGYGKSVYSKQHLTHISRAIINDPVSEYPGMVFETPEEMISYVKEHRVFRVRSIDPGEFPVLCGLAWDVGRCTLFVEEANTVIPPHEQLAPVVKDLLLRGRHKEISLVLISQRFTHLNINARSQFTRLITFHQHSEQDVKALERETGHELGDVVRTLKPGEYIEVTAGGTAERKALKVPFQFPEPPKPLV